MEHLRSLVQSLANRIGYPSNRLLKCVLLNTTMELFGYIATSSHAVSYIYRDWTMEDFHNCYTLLPDPGHLSCSDAVITPLPSDGKGQADLQQNLSMSEYTIYPSQKLKNTLPMEESMHKHDCGNTEHQKADVDQNNTLVGPVDAWLELPVYCFGEMDDLATSAVLNYIIVEGNVLMTSCHSATDEQSNINGCNFLFNDDSISWDSYDFLIGGTDSNRLSDIHSWSSGFGSSDSAISDIEDWFMMVEEHDVRNLLYPELFSIYPTTKSISQDTPKHPENPTSSTPRVKSTYK